MTNLEENNNSIAISWKITTLLPSLQVQNMMPVSGMGAQPMMTSPMPVPVSMPAVAAIPQVVNQGVPQVVPQVVPMAGIPAVMPAVVGGVADGVGGFIAPVQQENEPINLVLRVR